MGDHLAPFSGELLNAQHVSKSHMPGGETEVQRPVLCLPWKTTPAVTSLPSGQGSSLPRFATRRVQARPPPQGCLRPGRLQAWARRNPASPGEGAGDLAAARRPRLAPRLGDRRWQRAAPVAPAGRARPQAVPCPLRRALPPRDSRRRRVKPLTYVGAAGERLPARRRVGSHGGQWVPDAEPLPGLLCLCQARAAAGAAPGAGATPGPPRAAGTASARRRAGAALGGGSRRRDEGCQASAATSPLFWDEPAPSRGGGRQACGGFSTAFAKAVPVSLQGNVGNGGRVHGALPVSRYGLLACSRVSGSDFPAEYHLPKQSSWKIRAVLLLLSLLCIYYQLASMTPCVFNIAKTTLVCSEQQEPAAVSRQGAWEACITPTSNKQVFQVQVWKTAADSEVWFHLLLAFTHTISRLHLAVVCLQLYLWPLSGPGPCMFALSQRSPAVALLTQGCCCGHPCDPWLSGSSWGTCSSFLTVFWFPICVP